MAKMHVNPKTKEKGRCKAKSPETCTFNNGEGLHFQTMGEADLWIAEALENEAGGQRVICNHSRAKRLKWNRIWMPLMRILTSMSQPAPLVRSL